MNGNRVGRCLPRGIRNNPRKACHRVHRRRPHGPFAGFHTSDSRPRCATRVVVDGKADRAGSIRARVARCIRCNAVGRWHPAGWRFGSSQSSRRARLGRFLVQDRSSVIRIRVSPLYAAGSAASFSSCASCASCASALAAGFESTFSSSPNRSSGRSRSRRGASRHNRSRSYCSLVSGSKT